MKPGVSTLNPYATAYVPLSKREVTGKVDISGSTSKFSGGNQTSWYVPAEHTQKKPFERTSSDPDVPDLASHSPFGFHGSSSQNPNELNKKHAAVDEEFDILAYLQMSFPGMSNESLNDVYQANHGDLEATIDMLNQLEFDTYDAPENLPDFLDIGDVSELGSLPDLSSAKLKRGTGEGSASSSASPTV